MIRKTGFHGTSRAAAEAIIGSRRFKASEKSTEWLGRGIYFYLKHGDANTWGGSAGGADKVVISALISYTSKEYIDFDSAKGKKLLDTALFSIMEEANSRGIAITLKNAQKNQCAVCNWIWREYSELKVMLGTFKTTPTDPAKPKILIDTRPERKELCARNNSCISDIKLVV